MAGEHAEQDGAHDVESATATIADVVERALPQKLTSLPRANQNYTVFRTPVERG
jgi:hypothetical protein